jgi:tRNA-2-methylthio-N6-dimethylallyladenosine synthase
VPFVRGRETSRPPEEVQREVESLVSRGTREVTLLGQNVLAYGRDLRERTTFPALLAQLNDIRKLWRIRFTTCHPRDADWNLINAMANFSRACEHLHLPIQAGTDGLLSEMNRGYTVDDYQQVMERLRAFVPGIAITTDIMVGFPGETDEDYEESLRLYARLRFDAAFTFAYSIRPGTRAADRPDQVPHDAKIARLNRLIEMQNAITREINAGEVGRVVEVLVDGPAERGEGLLAGKARNNKQVIFPGPLHLTGSLVSVRLTSSDLWGFRGLAPHLP